jgi:uncharacterized membrane protein (UPF0127 family)
MNLRITASLLAALLTVATACSSAGGQEQDDGLVRLRFVNRSGDSATLRVEVADTAAERQQGLSKRESLAPDTGMLFVFEQRGRGFWMQDTGIPLTAAFIDRCGTIVALADMQPFTTDIHQTERDYSFGLEVNQGWFKDHGIAVEDRVELPEDLRGDSC